jgi:hypothetical protein
MSDDLMLQLREEEGCVVVAGSVIAVVMLGRWVVDVVSLKEVAGCQVVLGGVLPRLIQGRTCRWRR